MTRIARKYLAFVLIAMLAFTSQSMAVARGATGVAGQIVLCTGTGPVAVYVDEDGQPTGPPHICPDFALHFLEAVAAPDIAPVPMATTVERAVFAPGAIRAETRTIIASARAPPAAV